MVSYVKFIRCTQSYFNGLTTKDQDTLYFVYQPNTTDKGLLYLGNRLISGTDDYNSTNSSDVKYISFSDIKDIILSQNISDGDILLYNEAIHKWENHALQDLLTYSTVVGATETSDGIEGLVPQPKKDDRFKFLMGDGTWQEVNTYDEELHSVVRHLIGTDSNMSAREIAEDVIIDVNRRVGNLEQLLNGPDFSGDTSLRSRVVNLETAVGNFQASEPKYVNIGEAITFFDNSITELDNRLRWHGLEE